MMTVDRAALFLLAAPVFLSRTRPKQPSKFSTSPSSEGQQFLPLLTTGTLRDAHDTSCFAPASCRRVPTGNGANTPLPDHSFVPPDAIRSATPRPALHCARPR